MSVLNNCFPNIMQDLTTIQTGTIPACSCCLGFDMLMLDISTIPLEIAPDPGNNIFMHRQLGENAIEENSRFFGFIQSFIFLSTSLQSTKSPKEYAEGLVKEAHQYNGFNLILADIKSKSMVYVSNRPKGETVVIQEVSPGIHVLSNAKLDSPWHKVRIILHFLSLIN